MKNYDYVREDFKKRVNVQEKNVFLFPIVAVIFIVIGIIILNRNNEFMKNAKTTTAKIYTEMNTYANNDESTDSYKSYAEYYVDGKKYYEPIVTSKSETNIGPFQYIDTRNGDEITIYYNPDNPSEIMEDANNIIPYVFIGLGGFTIVIVILHYIYKFLANQNIVSSNNSKSVEEKIESTFNDDTLEKIETVQKSIFGPLNFIRKGIIFIVGIAIILFGVLCLKSDYSFCKNFKETTAVITKINQTEERDANNQRYLQSHIYIRYQVDGETYNEELDKAPGYKEKDTLTVYYNSKNPSEVRFSNKMSYSGLIIIIVGFFITFTGMLGISNLKLIT